MTSTTPEPHTARPTRRRRHAVLLLAAALAAPACAGDATSSSAPAPSSPGATDDGVDGLTAARDELEDLVRLPVGALEDLIGRRLLDASGFDDAQAVLVAAAFPDLAGEAGWSPAGRSRPFTAPATSLAAAAMYEMTHAAFPFTVQAFGKATGDFRGDGDVTMRPSDTPGVTETITTGSYRATASVAQDAAVDGISGNVAVDAELDVATCPDADGRARLELRTDARLDVADTTTSAFGRTELDVVVDVQLDDSANVVSTRFDTAVEVSFGDVAGSTSPTGRSARVRGVLDVPGPIADLRPGPEHLTSFVVERRSQHMPQQLAEGIGAGLLFIVGVIVVGMLDNMEAQWRSGACVDVRLQPSTGPSQLAPSTAVDITVQSTARTDGAPTGGTARASLDGEGTLSAPTEVPVPGPVRYTAAATNDRSGTVAVEVSSRRGIGRAELELSTGGAWRVDSTWQGFHVTGVKCGGRTGRWDLRVDGSPGAGVALGGALVLDVDRFGSAGGYTFTGTSSAGGQTFTNTAAGVVRIDEQADGSLALALTPSTGNVTNGSIGRSGAEGTAVLVAVASADGC